MPKPTDIAITEVRLGFSDYAYRFPIKFGGRALDRATLLDVAVRVRTRDGREAVGFGSMPLGATWAWPSVDLGYDEKLGAMRDLARRIAGGLPDASGGEALDAVQHGTLIEGLAAADPKRGQARRHGSEPVPFSMPKLCALVVASPFDAAVHDAFGKAAGRSAYACYGAEFVNHDLARYLDDGFAGEYLDRYVTAEPRPRMPLYHLVGALDPLTPSDVAEPVGDGLPETLGEWIVRDQLTHLKIKLNGDDLDWDVARVLGVNRVCDETAPDRAWRFSTDFNEQCRDVAYLLAFLNRIEEASPAAFERIQYIEQPTARDLKAHPENRMHAAAKVKPVVIDESLVDYEALLLAEEMGYSGVALKACKGQTQALLMAAAAQKRGMFLCVQDLTCPGASFIQSAGLAAHVPGVAAIEANARQYFPAANDGWRDRFPGLFTVTNGEIETGLIAGPGLGAVPPDYGGEDLASAGH